VIVHLERAGWLSVRRSVGTFPNSYALAVPSTIGGHANV
jgi:hypothetical protein